MSELNFNRDADLTRSRSTVDLDVAEMYAKGNCKKCNGKGYLKFQSGAGTTVRKDRPIMEYYEYCSCTHKTARKYG